jgi:nicotinamide-nucleotide amidase
VAYSNRAKVDLLAVPERSIAEHGAVSEPVAAAMAAGIRQRAGADIGIGITGIAGPEGGTDQKPVGTVVISIAWGEQVRTRLFRFPGGRQQVKTHAAQAALAILWRWLSE